MSFAFANMIKKTLHSYRGETHAFHILNTPWTKRTFTLLKKNEFGARKTMVFHEKVNGALAKVIKTKSENPRPDGY